MDEDCLRQILLHCKINDILTFNSVSQDLNKIINNNKFWKLLMLRDFEDINKLSNETWLDYYKKRSINYGIPILINNDIYQYNQVKQFLSFILNDKRQNLILTKDGDLHIINNKSFVELHHDVKVKKIYQSDYFYFVDFNNCLYKLKHDASTELIKQNVKTVITQQHPEIYYTDNTNEKLTYRIDNDISQRIFDFEILDLIFIKYDGCFDYVIKEKNILSIGRMVDNKYKLKKYELKATQLSLINSKIVIILCIDGSVVICKDNKFRKIKIPNVKMLGYNSFLTKNGDLYYFDKRYKEVLIDTDVVDVSYISNDGEDGCYVKRNII